VYFPTSETVRRIADTNGVGSVLDTPRCDWDLRQWLTPPGMVWSVTSDTCMTGRTDAPKNVAYGEYGQEFVFRQPRNDQELAAVLVAASHETYDCYRFDGLHRWTLDSALAWAETRNVVTAWLEHNLSSGHLAPDTEIAGSLRDYRIYLEGAEFARYWTAITGYLAAQ
jgi:hypothetical protein